MVLDKTKVKYTHIDYVIEITGNNYGDQIIRARNKATGDIIERVYHEGNHIAVKLGDYI